MKVQRCPSCGARYNADRLEPGVVFDCNRCGTAVTVEATAPLSLGLLVAGLLVLAALFVWNPAVGAVGTLWPWEVLQHRPSLGALVATVLWALLGLWAVLTALVPAARGRGVATVALGTVAVALATTPGFGGFPIVTTRSFPWMLAVAALAAGLGLVQHRRRGPATVGLLLGGAVAVLLAGLVTFAPNGETTLQAWIGDLQRLASGQTGRGPVGLGDVLGGSGSRLVVWIAAAGAVLVALGVRARAFAFVLALLLLVGMLMPGAARVGQALEGGFTWETLGRIAEQGAGGLLVTDGVALWALLALATADLVGSREGTP